MTQNEDTLDNVLEVAGNEVVLKTSFPLKDGNANILSDILTYDPKDLETAIPMLTRLVESWEFDGDPTDEAVYQEMDTLRELYPLARHADEYVAGLLSQRPKNSASASSSP